MGTGPGLEPGPPDSDASTTTVPPLRVDSVLAWTRTHAQLHASPVVLARGWGMRPLIGAEDKGRGKQEPGAAGNQELGYSNHAAPSKPHG